MTLWRKRMNYDRKYCAHCNMFKPLEGGVIKQTKFRPRWICKSCRERIEKANSNVVPIL